MAHRWSFSQGELIRHDHALNDHYCPNAATCRHAVIDMSTDNREHRTAAVDEQCVTLFDARQERYYPEIGCRHPIERRRPADYAHARGSSPMSGYTPSSDGGHVDENLLRDDTPCSDSVVSTCSTYQAPHKLPAYVYEREEAKIGRAFMKKLTHDSISTRIRLAYLESFLISNTDQLAQRCDGLTDICALFNQQYKLLMRQHDNLLDIMEKQGNEFRLRMDDMHKWASDEAHRTRDHEHSPDLIISTSKSTDQLDIQSQQRSGSPAKNEALPSPLSVDSGVFMLKHGGQVLDPARLLNASQASQGSKKRKGSNRGGGISKTSKQRRVQV